MFFYGKWNGIYWVYLIYQNNGNLMQIKRTFSRKECSQMDQLINQLREDQQIRRNSLIKSRINNPHLQQYFTNINQFVSAKNMHHYKGYQTLTDGLYILLKGEVKFEFGERFTQKQKMKKSKSQCCSTLINQPWFVFESTYKNCTTVSQSYLLRIGEEQALLCKFYQLFNLRSYLYTNCYLSQDHQKLYDLQQIAQPFNVNLKMHSYFSFKTYFFRQVITLDSPGIISKGRAKLRINQAYSHQFDQCGGLLPNLKYQVTSSQVQIMIVHQNQTLCYNFQIFATKEISKSTQSLKVAFNKGYKTEISTPKFVQIRPKPEKMKEINNRGVTKLFKQSQHYSIISSFLCQRSLNFAKRHNFLHCIKKKKENRFAHPLILFDIANETSKLDTPKFSNSKPLCANRAKTNYISCHKNTLSQSQSAILRRIKLPPDQCSKLIRKYKQTSTQIFDKPIKNKRGLNLTLDQMDKEESFIQEKVV